MRRTGFLKRLAVVFGLGLLVSGCGRAQSQMSGDDQVFMQAVNSSVADLEEALKTAFAASTLAVGGKVQRLAEEIRGKGCQRTVQKAKEDFDASWDSYELVQSRTCPLYLNRRWAFHADRLTWTIDQNFSSKEEAFVMISGIRRLNIQGAITVEKQAGGSKTISGSINYFDFELRDLGRLNVQIETEQRYTGASGQGRVTMTVPVNQKVRHVELRWSVDTLSQLQVDYLVDGTAVAYKDFNSMFSAFGLIEIMDKSLQMRYL